MTATRTRRSEQAGQTVQRIIDKLDKRRTRPARARSRRPDPRQLDLFEKKDTKHA
jgi:hypothetical protein